MHPWLHKVEEWVDRLIPPSLILLAGIIVVEIFFHDFAEHYHTVITWVDHAIIFLFVLDLIFKWNRIRKIPRFLRECWLDIIAVFPFATLFRVAENVFVFSMGVKELVSKGQPILHEGVEIQKEVARIMREAESVGKVSRVKAFLRSGRFIRIFRIFARSPRFLKAFAFYEKPSGKPLHHVKPKARPHWHREIESTLAQADHHVTVHGKRRASRKKTRAPHTSSKKKNSTKTHRSRKKRK